MASRIEGNDNLRLLSKGLYKLLSNELGTEYEVQLRRQFWQAEKWLLRCSDPTPYVSMDCLSSGSRAEGILMASSDIDLMMWPLDTVVVEDCSQLMRYFQYFKTIIMMDCEMTSPGFTFLKCITPDNSVPLTRSLCLLNRDKLYVSSTNYRERYKVHPGESVHGPCVSSDLGGCDMDFAYCLKCVFWPRQADQFIPRLKRCKTVSDETLKEIVTGGCHVVPIASKQPLVEDMEWRISFSLAEQRLVHSMNHCQFLCYGLWKIFLNEVIKKTDGVEDLLCSYFLKTLIFWEMCDSTTDWSIGNLIFIFFKTFKKLINYVSVGYCPKFFIPENNMFAGKIFGAKQKLLMSRLCSLLDEGYRCLVRCPSLRVPFQKMIMNPSELIRLSIEESLHLSESAKEILKLEYLRCRKFCGYIGTLDIMSVYSRLSKITNKPEFILILVALRKRRILQYLAENILLGLRYNRSNKQSSRQMNIAFRILQNNATYLGYRRLFKALFFYRYGMYAKAIKLTTILKCRLQLPSTFYHWSINEEQYRLIKPRNQRFCRMIRYIADDFVMNRDITLPELFPEGLSVETNTGTYILFVPPLVLAFLILFLSYHRTNDIIRRNDILREVQRLLLYNTKPHIHPTTEAMSWEILGICHQMCGEHLAAYYSYINAVNDKYNEFRSATITRICCLVYQMIKNK